MAFDYTNLLENATQANNGDFIWYDRAGASGNVAAANTAGEWCEENGGTTSNGTGPASNPTGRAGFVYTETSSPVATTVMRGQRNTTFDTTATSLVFHLIYNLNIETASEFYVEYATAATPNETTDWTILATIAGTLTDTWISNSWDIGAVAVSTTTRYRIRCNLTNAFTNDFAISTWREVGVDLASLEQEGFQFRNDDGSESAATDIGAQDAEYLTMPKETNTLLRYLINADGTAGAKTLQIEYTEDGDADSTYRKLL